MSSAPQPPRKSRFTVRIDARFTVTAHTFRRAMFFLGALSVLVLSAFGVHLPLWRDSAAALGDPGRAGGCGRWATRAFGEGHFIPRTCSWLTARGAPARRSPRSGAPSCRA